MILVIAPEGTRAAAPHWKSGFLGIAEQADVPIVFAGVDAPNRQVVLSEAVPYTGDVGAVMDRARAFYAGKRGLKPVGAGPVRVEEEVES
jgi:1-acyl-sn-glycerol-3-phosphate acyltransferase